MPHTSKSLQLDMVSLQSAFQGMHAALREGRLAAGILFDQAFARAGGESSTQLAEARTRVDQLHFALAYVHDQAQHLPAPGAAWLLEPSIFALQAAFERLSTPLALSEDVIGRLTPIDEDQARARHDFTFQRMVPMPPYRGQAARAHTVRVGRQLLAETTEYLAQVAAKPDTHIWTVADAETWGLEQHRSINHLRPQSDEPYEVHLGEVVTLIKSVPHTRRMVAGGWLHDVIDDIPGATREIVAAQTDDSVATLVDALSDHEKGQGNRKQRKAAERARIAGADWETQTVRVADIISNVRTIVLRNPEFAKVYVPEKAALLEVLTKADPVLLWAAHQMVRDAQAQLLAIGGANG